MEPAMQSRTAYHAPIKIRDLIDALGFVVGGFLFAGAVFALCWLFADLGA